jgi:hypothetical protein
VADNGEPYSLVIDTDEGKYSDISILNKYLRVIEGTEKASSFKRVLKK